MKANESWRKTTQRLAPLMVEDGPAGEYNPYPGYPIGPGKFSVGYAALAQALARFADSEAQRTITLDGYGGVFWQNIRQSLDACFAGLGLVVHWLNVESALRSPAEVDRLVAPYLGGDDPLFGTRFEGSLADFFDRAALQALQPDPQAGLSILYGCGAALAGWPGPLVYFDLPKNEIQFRARAGSIANLGAAQSQPAKAMYKRFYFVDWPALNRHKAGLLPRLDWMVDEQRPDEPLALRGADLRAALNGMAHSFFRARPWFEPGPWGGQWIKQHIPRLPQDALNYAWSFELIAPENGLALESDGRLLEVSFDTLMDQEHRAVLGDCAGLFGLEFPIRYDFLDTFAGGNLSIQCHPRPEYARRRFGERFTQDECYYILDCGPEARVYLGFQANLSPPEFRQALEHSAASGTPVEIDRFVQSVPVKQHDFVLIPNGTIHGAGRDNLVLEISATPYIFTFKMYDWLRLDLDGKPRSLNIARAFENLVFERQGERIPAEFVSHPAVLSEGEGRRIVHCPTHPDHFYDVHRLEFSGRIALTLEGSCHVLSLVEGQTVLLETSGGMRQVFNYAETFVVPAAAGQYWLTAPEGTAVKVVKTFVKPMGQWAPGVL